MDYMFGKEECSSGCESGWTLYLQHSSISRDASYDQQHDSPDSPRGNRVFTKISNGEDEEDEDLSMVSDASSGPPHLHEEEGYGAGNEKNSSFYPYATDELPSSSRINNINLTKKKTRQNRCSKQLQQHSSLLDVDDTASSPLFDFCNKTRSQTSVENVVEYSQGYSTTHEFQVRPPYQDEHYDYFQSGNQLQQQNQWFEGKRW